MMRATPRYQQKVPKQSRVDRKAPAKPSEALEFARRKNDAWDRCQHLAYVAWQMDDPQELKKVIGEALEAAYELKEPNRIVSVAAWPVRVMVAKGDPRLASVVHELLQKIQTEPNPVRRAHALSHLFDAGYSEPRLRESVLGLLLRTCEQMNIWRRPIILSSVALILAKDDPVRAEKVIEMIGEGQKSRQTRRYIAAGQWMGPHEFFPYYAKPAP
jgi:hypothetical protein